MTVLHLICLAKMEWWMSQRKMQQRAADAIALSDPVRFEARPAGRLTRLMATILRRLARGKPGTAEDQAHLHERLER